jgi:hypothetical protein
VGGLLFFHSGAAFQGMRADMPVINVEVYPPIDRIEHLGLRARGIHRAEHCETARPRLRVIE